GGHDHHGAGLHFHRAVQRSQSLVRACAGGRRSAQGGRVFQERVRTPHSGGVHVTVEIYLDVCIVVLTLSIVAAAVRVLLGPTLPDRVVAAVAVATHVIALSVLVAMKLESVTLFDIALALAILSFLTAVVVGKYLEKGHV